MDHGVERLMNCPEVFWIGAASGVVAAAAISVLRFFVGTLLSLALGVFWSRGIRGPWKTSFTKNGETLKESATVRQLGRWVWGKIEYPDKTRTYKFRGTMHNDVLVATYKQKGRSRAVDRGAFTLRLMPGGDRLLGTASWPVDDSTEIRSSGYEWELQHS